MAGSRQTNPIEIQVLNKTLAAVAEEMGIVLQRSALSANIKERRDFSCAIFDGQGRLLAQAAHIPVHLGAMPDTVAMVRRNFSLGPGEVVITNDPFAGGTHLPDITLVAPVFHGRREPGSSGEPDFYLAVRAHHADVGGRYPGSMSLTRDLDEEGVLIRPQVICRNWSFMDGPLQEITGRMRAPGERRGDLEAQLAALIRGNRRLGQIMDRHGRDGFIERLPGFLDYGRRFMEAAIAEIPDGTYRFEDFLDDDGDSMRSIPINAVLEIRGKRARVDLSGSADQLDTCLNATKSVTRSAVYYCFFCLVGEGYPVNAGSIEPIEVVTRPGSICDPVAPAPVAAGNVETSQRIVDVVFGALSKALPDVIPAASCGSMNNISLGGIMADGTEFTYYETIGGGMGARPGSDGLSAVQVHMTNTLNTPIEALEQAYPFRIDRYSIRRGSGGTGRTRGGDGMVRRYLFVEPASVSILSERRLIAPYGLHGGGPGKRGRNYLISGDTIQSLGGKCRVEVGPGDILEIRTPGGGGMGECSQGRAPSKT